jgi:integrase
LFVAIQSLTREELLALLRAAKAHRERDWLLILLAYWHGLRASESVGIKAHDIASGYLTTKRLKGSEKTVQRLVEHEEPLLNERQAAIDYVAKLDGNQKPFSFTRQHFWRLMQRYGKTAGIPKHKRHPHTLKHSIVTDLVAAAGVPAAQKRAGHKSGKSTLEYAKLSDQEADAAVEKTLKG